MLHTDPKNLPTTADKVIKPRRRRPLHAEPRDATSRTTNKKGSDGHSGKAGRPPSSVLYRKILKVIRSNDDPSLITKRLLRMCRVTSGASAVVCLRRKKNKMAPGPQIRKQGFKLESELTRQLVSLGYHARVTRRAQLRELAPEDSVVAVAVPISAREGEIACLCAIVPRNAFLDQALTTLQVFASHLALASLPKEAKTSRWEAKQSAATIELLGRMQQCDQVERACHELAHSLHEFLGCERVAVATVSPGNGKCTLRAVSGLADIDSRTEIIRSFASAMNESLNHSDLRIWTSESKHSIVASPLRKLALLTDSRAIVSGPIRDMDGRNIGAWTFHYQNAISVERRTAHLIRAIERPVGTCLEFVRRSERSALSRAARSLWRRRKSWQLKTIAACCLLLSLILLIPMRYRVTCQATVAPVERRFVTSRFDGILAESFRKPGDEVGKGDLLARLDGREIALEVASLRTELDRAEKERQVALASGDTSKSQQLQLQTERLQLRIQLLEQRTESLEIHSPVDGILLRGDLDNAVGAPIQMGQSLFEIGPLNQLRLELAIPAHDVRHVKSGNVVNVRFDAASTPKSKLKLQRIEPVAEVKDGQNVFVGYSVMENDGGQLRPGMSGQATILGSQHTLSWILFHRPWIEMMQWFGF